MMQNNRDQPHRGSFRRFLAKINYQLCHVRFRLKNKITVFWKSYAQPQAVKAISWIYVILLLLASVHLRRFLDITNLKTNFPALLSTLAAMLGGILAIIFSFGTLLMQNAANSTSAGFYNIVAHDRRQHLVYWVIALTVIYCFGLSFIIGGLDDESPHHIVLVPAVQIAFCLLGVSFLLLYNTFLRIYERINPFSNIRLIQEEVFSLIRRISITAEDIANLTLKHPDLPPDYDHNKALAVAFQYVKPQIRNIGSRLNHLFDYHDRLVISKEQESAKLVLDAIRNILVAYIKMRNKSSLILPDNNVFFVGISDSQDFLSFHLESLVNRGKAYVRDNNDNGVTHIIYLLQNLVLASKDIQYVTDLNRENPIFSQCRGWLDHLTEFSLTNKALEAVFQCANAYKDIAVAACEKQMHLEVRAIIALASRLCITSLLNNQEVVWSRGIDVFMTSMRGLMRYAEFDLKIQIEYLFNMLLPVVLLSIKSQEAVNSLNNLNNQMKLETCFSSVAKEANFLSKCIENSSEKGEREKIVHKLETIAEAYERFLYQLSEAAKTADAEIVRTIGDSIANIGIILLHSLSKVEHHKEEFLKQVRSYIYLPQWFVRRAGKVGKSSSFDTLVEAATKIGLYAVEIQEEEIANDAIDAIALIALEMFEKEGGNCKYGFTPPRVMEKSCYIGILALKSGFMTIVGQLRNQLDKFQEKFEKETISKLPEGSRRFGVRRDQICHDLFRLREECERSAHQRLERRIMDRASDRLLSKVSLIDIDRFIYEIWKVSIEGSPIEEELRQSSN